MYTHLGIPPHFVVLVGQMFVRGGEEVEGAHLSLQPSVLLQTAPRGQGPGPARDLDNLADICLMLTAPRDRCYILYLILTRYPSPDLYLPRGRLGEQGGE